MLLAAMALSASRHGGARDLAVECGFERLSEVQEEILWLCEAPMFRHLATQVLDQLAEPANRHGLRFRTRSWPASGVRDVNKGPHISAAVAALDDILGRMDSYQHKRPLSCGD